MWFVELAPLADARLVPQAVASVLGVKEEAGRPVLEALVKYVRDRQLLLILDNCEHLLHACAELATKLLRSGRGLKILASSREPLHVAGETTYPVPSLAVPESAGDRSRSRRSTQYEAVRLFVDRAAAAQPAFQVTRQNAAAVADICRRLDGIPLAIELAAARVRALSVEKIAARLSDRFRLLTRRRQDCAAAPADPARARSTGATTCFRNTSARCCGGSRYSPAAGRSKPRKPWVRAAESTNRTCSTS